MKALRYSLLLPLLHLAISLPVVLYEEASTWLYMQRLQIVEDFEKADPDASHSLRSAWSNGNPCYEYRPSIADQLIALQWSFPPECSSHLMVRRRMQPSYPATVIC